MKQLQQLEQNSGIISEISLYPIICDAIAAYCHGQDAELGSLLNKIPYRSPYRDLSTILKALVRLPEPSQVTLDLLSKLPATSIFSQTAHIVCLALSSEGWTWQHQWHGVGPAGHEFIARLRGIDAQIIQPRAMLPSSHSDFDLLRIQALTAEQESALEAAIEYWQSALQLLKNQQDKKTDLKSALILRRIAVLYQQQLGRFSEAIEQPLLDSLDYDPNDAETFLTLIGFYQEMGETENHRQFVDRAVKQFPQHTEILLIAVDVAIQRDTFKKAARLATHILQQDPINQPVRQLLIQAHLAHARKQVLVGRVDLAEKELDAADAMERKGFESGIIESVRGMLAYREGDSAHGEMLIEQSCQRSGYLRGYFRAVVEGLLLELDRGWVKPYQKLLKQLGRETLGVSEVLDLLAVIQAYNNNEQGSEIEAALTPLVPSLRKVAKLKYSRDEIEMICECWWQMGHLQLLLDFSEPAEQLWPDEPLFSYFRIYALSSGLLDRVRAKDLECLTDCLELAKQRGEVSLVERIQSFVQPPEPYAIDENFNASFSFRI